MTTAIGASPISGPDVQTRLAFPAGTILAATTKSTFSPFDHAEDAQPLDSTYPTGIIAIDPQTGAQTVVSEGKLFVLPTYIAPGPTGTIYVCDLNAGENGLGAIIQVILATGGQVLVAQGGLINHPNGLAYFPASKMLYVVNVGKSDGAVHTLVAIDINSGAQTLVSETPSGFSVGVGLCIMPKGAALPWSGSQIFVGDEPGNVQGEDPGKLWRINPLSGVQTLVAWGDLFNHPSDICATANGVLIGNTGSAANGYAGSVVHVDLATGRQKLVASFPASTGLDSLDVDADGTIYVGAIANGPTHGRIYAVDPKTGAQSVLSEGQFLSMVEGIRVLP
jgi:sugar lactone lactonase YvrE